MKKKVMITRKLPGADTYVETYRYLEPSIVTTIDGIDYADIPEYSNYAVSNCGIVIQKEDHKRLTIGGKKHNHLYLRVRVYCDLRKAFTRQGVHRLVALAWVPNVDWVRFDLVNHIDGDKHNPHHSNLEWVDYSGNSYHAYRTGLRQGTIAVRARNIHDGLEYSAYSLHDLTRQIGVSVAEVCNYLKRQDRTHPLSSTWELRLADDESPWEISSEGRLDNRSINEYMFYLDGKKYIFDKVSDIFEMLNLEILPGYNFKQYMKHIEEKTGIKIDVKSLRPRCNDCQVLEHKTKQVKCFKSGSAAAKHYGVPKSTMKGLMRKGQEHMSHGLSIRVTSTLPWPETFIRNHKENTNIQVNDGKKVVTYSSINETEKQTGINSKAIRRHLKTGQSYGKYTFKRVN